MWKKLLRPSAILIPTLLSGCAPKMTAAPVIPPAVSDFCILAKAIEYARKPTASVEDQRNRFDSAPTVASIEAHNLRYDAVCSNR